MIFLPPLCFSPSKENGWEGIPFHDLGVLIDTKKYDNPAALVEPPGESLNDY